LDLDNKKTITIKIGGEAGFGIKIAGATLAKVFARSGYELFDMAEYPSLIRGGHNVYHVTLGEKVYHPVLPVDLLIALNQKTVDLHLAEMAEDGAIIFDPERAKVSSDKVISVPVPLSKITKDIGGSDLMKNTVALGAALAVLGGGLEGLLEILKKAFAKKSPAVVNMNVGAASGGYNYVKENFKQKFIHQLAQLPKKEQLYLTGNEAVGLGALAGGARAYFAYPMTPATSLMEFLAKQGPKTGMLVRQCEDEIAVLNSAIGAGFAGTRAMVGTAGGGFALMVEALGLSAMTETPVVIFVAQRPAPATGLPTWSEQGDLRFLLHAAPGDSPRAIIAPGDQSECFYHTVTALNLAEKYQIPVFVLSDKNLGESGMTVSPFDLTKVKIERGEWLTAEQIQDRGGYQRYEVTASGVSPRALPGIPGSEQEVNSDEHDEYGYSTEDPETRSLQMEKRMRKQDALLKEIPDPILYGPEKAELTLVSWGSTKGPILQAMLELEGLPINFLHFIYLWPFPTDGAVKMLKAAKQLMVVENNYTGQFDGLIKQHVGRVPEEKLLKYNGRPFWPHEIVLAAKKVFAKN
jgi:2-oxoglutarate ferredoxin oxidoreductase subunit alpha